jgi:outer membrane protein OmpA-like peptidoglycan-associated protein
MKATDTNWIKNTVVVLTISVFSLLSIALYAQKELVNFSANSKLYVQPNVGLSEYFGDFNREKYWNQNPQFAFGAVVGYQLSPVFGLRGQFLKTNLYSERSEQNIVFNSTLWDGAFNLTFNIIELFDKYNEKRFLNFYFFSGGGISSFKSKLTDMVTGELIGEHSERQYEFILPIGAGAAFRVNNTFSINIEYGDHSIFGGTKLDFTDNSKQNNDHYSYFSAGLQINFGVKDTDDDGIRDKDDLCPNAPGKVELTGCPDADGDGISDNNDACPQVSGIPEYKGCPDTDGDGIIDSQDACPTSAGKKALMGCPDRDNDGISDKDDNCPDVPGQKEMVGCPDRDGDGIADNEDICPDNKGLAIFAGCPDTDGDGIIDRSDSCMYTAGPEEHNGCPDMDNDSVADKDDMCPDIAGKKELAGCPDRDNDGVIDSKDACPDKKGISKFNGCPDTDGDGIPDVTDNCPEIAGVAANKGCPKVSMPTVTILIKTIYFGSGSSEFLPTFGNTFSLDAIVRSIKENPQALISVAGYEDSFETGESGVRLSEKRVDYIINYLEQKGMKSLKVQKSFLEKSNPIADNKTSEGRALNRRVEIKILK